MLGDSGYSERSGEIYLSYVGHVTDQAVLLRDGSKMAMGHVGGATFELEDPALRNARLRNLNTLLRNIADDDVSLSTHLIRHPDVSELPQARFRSDFAARLDRAYRDRVLNGQLFRNDYYLSLIVSPRNVLGKMGSRIARFRKGPASTGDASVLRKL
jgi:type IV secretion system protein VirB4